MEIYYHYYDYDGIPHRVSYVQASHQCVGAFGYFLGEGFQRVEAYAVINEGERLSEKEFKAMVVAQRR